MKMIDHKRKNRNRKQGNVANDQQASIDAGSVADEDADDDMDDAKSDASGDTMASRESRKSGATFNSEEPFPSSAASRDAVTAGMDSTEQQQSQEFEFTVPAKVSLDMSSVPLIGGLLAGTIPFEDQQVGSSSMLVDKLSELFHSMSDICREQFTVIRRIFDPSIGTRLIRVLIGKFFDDPQFGLHFRIEMILNPHPPSQPLPPQEYLDALHTVREKLSGLYFIIIDYFEQTLSTVQASSTAAVKGTSLITGDDLTNRSRRQQSITLPPGSTKKLIPDLRLDASEYAEKNTRELKSYLEDHISQVFDGYLSDYFPREMNQLKAAYSDNLLSSVDDKELLKKLPQGAIPRLQPARFKSIEHINKTVGNQKFVSRVLMISTDAVTRMKSIGRDDPKLTWFLRDV